MAEWVSVCSVDAIPSGRALACDAAGVRIALYRDGDAIRALSDRCPHQGGSLGQGWIEEGEAVCPLHRWRFRLPDGRCMTVRGQNAHTFPVDLRSGTVWVRV